MANQENRILLAQHSVFPDANQLQACLQAVIQEQQQLCGGAASSTLFSVRLRQRLLILHRYFTALSRHAPAEARSPIRKQQNLQANLSRQKR